MTFQLDEATLVLRRTPAVFSALLGGMPDRWTRATEGEGTWSPFDIVGHLIHGERTDWIPRVEHILRHGDAVAFPSFVRDAMLEQSRNRPMAELLDAFASLRAESLARLAALRLGPADLERRGLHPELGPVTLGQHLATWTTHDLGHVAQAVRVMAKQYRDAVGPWRAYLSIVGA
jgi:hypothetical protein